MAQLVVITPGMLMRDGNVAAAEYPKLAQLRALQPRVLEFQTLRLLRLPGLFQTHAQRTTR